MNKVARLGPWGEGNEGRKERGREEGGRRREGGLPLRLARSAAYDSASGGASDCNNTRLKASSNAPIAKIQHLRPPATHPIVKTQCLRLLETHLINSRHHYS